MSRPNQFAYGAVMSEATKRAIGEANRGRAHTPEQRARMTESRAGFSLSEESRRKIADSKRGRPMSADARRKMSETRTGRALSPEHREALRSSMVGRKRGPLPPEWRANLVAGQRSRLERLGIARAPTGPRLRVPRPDTECSYCGGRAVTWDHIFPKSRGGGHEEGNLVPCCLSCNASKGPRTPDEWLAAGLVAR